jgi:hypothetical protein
MYCCKAGMVDKYITCSNLGKIDLHLELEAHTAAGQVSMHRQRKPTLKGKQSKRTRESEKITSQPEGSCEAWCED